jgi:hypothetical protein
MRQLALFVIAAAIGFTLSLVLAGCGDVASEPRHPAVRADETGDVGTYAQVNAPGYTGSASCRVVQVDTIPYFIITFWNCP